ncbi:AraC family transcriptional regulator [Brenneria goodwinii]|uniref:AraC family transcriptional regulator n=1 Tax=Brenneria goodwinii TaxID=1109412 RepID=A0A0G4JZW9_9GAMM|nr:AraC family transcriptional regulator [Brenneria goodwinii]ATA23854.1 AraC family transcriptional regulator [Brenneria goodwinii]MCG8155795.1 helix-turn-helix domain-containing protein [Brenneria goodwinii]MCG8160627.1 helix-turn-helix domain-containing protein [Brenneria goodwinii]MCG8166935.1 helix-turn-helix domain-containing protein [Brenneria goodwinii]MCG8172604.1 helix-turn-helix domain-containing protein [Brenneria goodwinii]
MNPPNSHEHLELISLFDRYISFNRLYANSIRYHHWHQCLEMLFVEEGYGVIIVDNQQYTMKPGRLFIFPPFKLHKVMVEDSQRDRYRRTIIHLDNVVLYNYLHNFPQKRALLHRLCHPDSRAAAYDLADIRVTLDTLFSRFIELGEDGNYSLEDIACLILQILTLLPPQAENKDIIDDSLSAKVMQWIEEHYMEKFSLDTLISYLNLSKSYVSRRFKQETGEMIHEYLLTRRIKAAGELLRTSNNSIDDISQQVGFSDSPYFITCFKKMIGRTPLQYRKNYAPKNHQEAEK